MGKGFVYLVGAGPGRADLITVRGAEVLGMADCIIYDKLANPALLRFAPKGAEILHVPKRIGGDSVTQEEINELILEKALAGLTVVRLKGGNPCIFGRCSEELSVLIEHGIDFEIVPGITAGIAVAAYAGIMLTDREYSSQVIFVTGQETPDKQKTSIDWPLLAKFNGTLVFYMGVGRMEYIVTQLMQNGMSPDAPVAVVTNATFPTQTVTKAPLAEISQKCIDAGIKPPAVIVVGTAAGCDVQLNWFMRQPLFGKNIVVTRDVPGNVDFADKIICRGGNPLKFPTIKIKPLTQKNDFLHTLAEITEYDWAVFTSGNGVAIFFQALRSLGKDARIFGSTKIAAIGGKTADKLSEFGIRADFIPDIFTGKELCRQLMAHTNLKDKKVLLLRSKIASDELVKLLEKAGAEVDDVAVYTAEHEKSDNQWLVEEINKGQVDWLTFASPSSVDGFFAQISGGLINSTNIKIASIGPVTTARLKDLGVNADITATEHTLDGLIDAIERTYK
ncbi:MAG: uroporphyrinogen-III C-methyltransferase [Sedimentisphaerales bacterium]|nr:uroporphyrinogen-III C-methyltransferase [Sedimentisphaerales bacterium]